MTLTDELYIWGENPPQVTKEQMFATKEREEKTHAEMTAYFATLPKWLDDGEMFALWTMTEKERRQWLEEHNPAVYLKPSSERKPERIGGVRI